MKDVEVRASKSYRVTIGSNLLCQIGDVAHRMSNASRAAIVSDSNVWPLYGEIVTDSLCRSGIDAVHFVFPAGESSKNGNTYLALLNFMAEHQLTRCDCLIALGGGVVGDLTGFAAATYLRGIPYFQLPTSLLAMVDSSVGGKTAIDLPSGKNLAGAFYQPNAVLCDTDTLATLPEDIFRDGCAEVIKYGILYDADLFAHLEERGIGFDRESVIARCIKWKRDVVAEDEFDTGLRMKLNLGHTIGHAVEKCSNYILPHGNAVSIGTAMISRAFKCVDTHRILKLLTEFGLPTQTEYSADMLYTNALSDKKRSGRKVNLIVPQAIGQCSIESVSVEKLKAIIEEGL